MSQLKLEDRLGQAAMGLGTLACGGITGAGTYKLIESLTPENQDLISQIGLFSLGLAGGVMSVGFLYKAFKFAYNAGTGKSE